VKLQKVIPIHKALIPLKINLTMKDNKLIDKTIVRIITTRVQNNPKQLVSIIFNNYLELWDQPI